MRDGRASTLRLASPNPQLLDLSGVELAVGVSLPPEAQSIRRFQVPPPHGETPLAEARFLLTAAAEIEHGLLLQYLYAAYSLAASAADLPAPGGGATLADRLIQIAVEEMGHLINVQNLLLLLGDAPYVDRGAYLPGGPQGDLYPFPFVLEPLAPASLAKYVSAESPLPWTIKDPAKRARVEEIIRIGKGAAGSLINHVGVLYAQIYWLFKPDDKPEKPWEDLPDSVIRPGWHLKESDLVGFAALQDRAAEASEFGFSPDLGARRFLVPITSRHNALELIDRIAEQGEGITNPTDAVDDSHFELFFSLFEGWDALAAQAGGNPVRAVPRYPNTNDIVQPDPEVEDGRITYGPTRRWAVLLNVRYQILLQKIALLLWLPHGPPDQPHPRRVVRTALMREMRTFLASIARRLTELPRRNRKSDGTTDIFAAAPFEVPSTELPRSEIDIRKMLSNLIDESATLIEEIKGFSGFDAITSEDRDLLRGISESDAALRVVLSSPSDSNSGTPPTSPPQPGNPPMPATSFARVKEILDGAIAAWTQANGGPPDLSVHGPTFGWETKEQLAAATARNKRLIDPSLVGNKTNLVIALSTGVPPFGRMPSGGPFLPDTQIQEIADWIDAGMPD